MTIAQPIQTGNLKRPSAIATLKDLADLLELEEEDDYGLLKPSQYAFKTAMDWLLDAYVMMGETFPRESTCTDPVGRITVDWTRRDPKRKVRLFCPSTAEQPVDIYHASDANSAVEDVTAVSSLVIG